MAAILIQDPDAYEMRVVRLAEGCNYELSTWIVIAPVSCAGSPFLK
jgi:hypothetical protein